MLMRLDHLCCAAQIASCLLTDHSFRRLQNLICLELYLSEFATRNTPRILDKKSAFIVFSVWYPPQASPTYTVTESVLQNSPLDHHYIAARNSLLLAHIEFR